MMLHSQNGPQFSVGYLKNFLLVCPTANSFREGHRGTPDPHNGFRLASHRHHRASALALQRRRKNLVTRHRLLGGRTAETPAKLSLPLH
jgi:hypothetical protein